VRCEWCFRKPRQPLGCGLLAPTLPSVTHGRIDAIIELANEELFKKRAAAAPLGQGTKVHFVRIMSTTDGRWLDRGLDANYCWDSIHRPVLFRAAINKIISEERPDGVRFLEIAPHPVLKACLEQCGGQPISLVRRPNPKVPAQHHKICKIVTLPDMAEFPSQHVRRVRRDWLLMSGATSLRHASVYCNLIVACSHPCSDNIKYCLLTNCVKCGCVL